MTTTRAMAVFLAVILLLAGCTNDPGPTPAITDPRATRTTALSTPGPEPDIRSSEAAIQALMDFIDADNTNGLGGFHDNQSVYDKVYDTSFLPDLAALEAVGAKQVGATTLSQTKVVSGPTDDPDKDLYRGHVQMTVVLEVCADTSKADAVLPEGTSAYTSDSLGKWVATVTMGFYQLGVGGNWDTLYDQWLVTDWQTDRGRPC